MEAREQGLAVVRILIGSGAFIANSFTLVVLMRIPGFSSHRSLVKHLTFSDMLIGIFGLLQGVLDTYHWVRQQPCSFVFLIILRSVVTASMLLVVTMAVEHFMAIFRPWSYKASFTQKRITTVVILIWVVSVLFQFARLPQTLYIFYGKSDLLQSLLNSTNTSADHSHPLFCQIYQHSAMHQLDSLILFIITCACLVIIIFIYTYIAINARARLRGPVRYDDHALSEHTKRHQRLMKTTFFILVTFVFCWAPACCVLFISSLRGTSDTILDKHIATAKTYVFLFPYFNSLCDPIIYSMRMREVKQGYRDILGIFKVNV